MLPLLDAKELKEIEDEEKIFGEDYYSEEEDNDQSVSEEVVSDINIQQYGSE